MQIFSILLIFIITATDIILSLVISLPLLLIKLWRAGCPFSQESGPFRQDNMPQQSTFPIGLRRRGPFIAVAQILLFALNKEG